MSEPTPDTHDGTVVPAPNGPTLEEQVADLQHQLVLRDDDRRVLTTRLTEAVARRDALAQQLTELGESRRGLLADFDAMRVQRDRAYSDLTSLTVQHDGLLTAVCAAYAAVQTMIGLGKKIASPTGRAAMTTARDALEPWARR